MKQRYIPPDTKEDIMLGKVLPLKALFPIGAFFFTGLIMSLTVLRNNWILQTAITLLPGITIIFIYILDLPYFVSKVAHWQSVKNKIVNLSFLAAFSNVSYECVYDKKTTIKRKKEMSDAEWDEEKLKRERKIFYEYKTTPWEIDPEEYKEQRADEFANDIIAAMQEGVSVSIYGICQPERTNSLDFRYSRLKSLSPELREIERVRIDYHYIYSRSAEETQYIIALSGKKQDLGNTPAFMSIGEEMEQLGSDNTQLTPSAVI